MSEERQSRRDKEDQKAKASGRRQPSRSKSGDDSILSSTSRHREKKDRESKRRGAKPSSDEEVIPGAVAIGTVASTNGPDAFKKEGKQDDRRANSSIKHRSRSRSDDSLRKGSSSHSGRYRSSQHSPKREKAGNHKPATVPGAVQSDRVNDKSSSKSSSSNRRSNRDHHHHGMAKGSNNRNHDAKLASKTAAFESQFEQKPKEGEEEYTVVADLVDGDEEKNNKRTHQEEIIRQREVQLQQQRMINNHSNQDPESAETAPQETHVSHNNHNNNNKNKKSLLFWVIGCLLLVTGAIVGTLFGLGILPDGANDEKALPVDGNTSGEPNDGSNTTDMTQSPTLSPSMSMPSAAPTFLAYSPPNQEQCENIAMGVPSVLVDGDQDLASMRRNFVFDFDVDLFMTTESELLFPEIEDAMQTNIMPKLAGCDDNVQRRRLLKGIISRTLANSDPYKYIFSSAIVSGIVQKDGECTIGGVYSALCVPIVVELTVYVKGDDLRAFQLIGRISSAFGNGNDIAGELNLGSPVRSLRLVGGKNLDPTASPSMAPSLQPSESPSALPTFIGTPSPTVRGTPVPTASPSNSPTVTTSERPTLVPVPGVTPLPTSIPSTSPSMVPSMVPTTSPSKVPSVAPTVTLSTNPSALPSTSPSVAPSVVPTVMSRRARIVHALESMGYPEQGLDVDVLNWMADVDDWEPTDDDAYKWLDRYVFTKAFEDTNGQDWVAEADWKEPGVSVCSWYQLECTNETVTVASFARLGLTGTLPAELGGLQRLTDLRINQANNTVKMNDNGSILPSVLMLTNLETLWYHFNRVESIGSEILALSNLKALHLRGNPFENFPTHLLEMTNLEVLRLDMNSLETTIPTEIGQLTNLQRLFLSINKFMAPIPEQLGDLTSLTFLQMSHNTFSTSIPSFLGNMTYLNELYIEDSGMTGTLPELGLLTNLKKLSFSDNNLVSPLPPLPTESLSSCVLTGNQFDVDDPNKGICTI